MPDAAPAARDNGFRWKRDRAMRHAGSGKTGSGGMTGKPNRLLLVACVVVASGIATSAAADAMALDEARTTYLLARVQKGLAELGIEHVVAPCPAPDSGCVLRIQLPADGLQLDFCLNTNLVVEAFRLGRGGNALTISGADIGGLLYGFQECADQMAAGQRPGAIKPVEQSPHFAFRALKFNLPWSSYRTGESLQLHMRTVRDLAFWERFLDMMVDNRFNALTLWNLHPFTFMIQPEKYPEATQFKGEEFEEWRRFWTALFQMARDRGIETYIVNWNIFTSPQMTEAHGVANYKEELEWHYGYTPPETSPLVVDYTRECVTQVINEYPNLTGLGVSVGERMKMPIEEAMQWIRDTFVEGMRRADRPARFIHRAPFSISPEEARKYIESYTDLPQPIIMEFKFNWSHSHSSPHLSITHGGGIGDQYWNPMPSNYRMAWMMRNEDFYMLNWGEPDFIREHIRINGGDHVLGYFVGSECYIPAKEYRMKEGVDYPWEYAFEKQWEFYQMWGRLLYDPGLSDDYFIGRMADRYGTPAAESMFRALKLGSRMPLRLASFYKSTWDFTLYAEGFINGEQIYKTYKQPEKAFINVREMATHKPLDAGYLSVADFVQKKIAGEPIPGGVVTPAKLAEALAQDADEALRLCDAIAGLVPDSETDFRIELNDIRVWAYLSRYFSDKLNGAVCYQEAAMTSNRNSQADAVEHLRRALADWNALVDITEAQYQEVSLPHLRTYKFSWKLFLPSVRRDIELAEELFEGENPIASKP